MGYSLLLPPRGTVVGGWAAGNRLRFAIRGVDGAGGRYGEFGAGGGLFWECGGWFYGTMAGPWWYHGTARVARGRRVPFLVLRMLIQAAPNRRQKFRAKGTQCDIKATPRPVDSQLIATLKRPQSHPKATPMRLQGSPKATPKPPSCEPKTTFP